MLLWGKGAVWGGVRGDLILALLGDFGYLGFFWTWAYLGSIWKKGLSWHYFGDRGYFWFISGKMVILGLSLGKGLICVKLGKRFIMYFSGKMSYFVFIVVKGLSWDYLGKWVIFGLFREMGYLWFVWGRGCLEFILGAGVIFGLFVERRLSGFVLENGTYCSYFGIVFIWVY